MVQTLKRQLLVVAAVAVVGAVVGTTALASPGQGRFGQRLAVRGGGPGPIFAPGGFGGPGFGGFGIVRPGPGRFGFGGPGDFRGPGRGAGILAADVLTPAASFLGISVSTLAADLKGGKTLAQEATAKGKTADALIDAIVASEKTVLDAENAAGWITDAQETSILAGVKAEVTSLVNEGPPVPPVQRVGPLDTVATYLGVGVADVQADLKAGKTLAQIATDHGKTVDGLVAALVAPAKTKLDASVAAGTITAAQEQTVLTRLTQQVTDFVNAARPTAKTATTRLKALLHR
jgi:hypothetical protein